MLDARFRPLLKWTRKPGLQNGLAHFKTPYEKTLDKLEYELRKLAARDILIEAGYRLDQIRNDGWPYSNAMPAHPGVVVYFEGVDGAMEFPCATYRHMADNLHAIALTLENLRAIDRYGVTLSHQQYLGFAALPPAPGQLTVEQAAEFVGASSGFTESAIIARAADYRSAYRLAASRLHPDAAGNNDGFYKLGRAKDVLDRHYGLGQAKTA